MNAIDSIKKQTYKNIEIIVVNDCSTQKEYYEYNWEENGICIIHLEENSKKKFGYNYACAGYVRKKGIEKASGKYIAFCDDDDIWFPNKLKLQINAMKKHGCKMSSTDGLIGKGVYDKNKRYKKYNAQHHYRTLQKIYRKKVSKRLDNGFPDIWDLKFLKIHNCAITSSVVVEKKVLDQINVAKYRKRGQDYDCWLKVLEYTNSVYLEDVCFYYDSSKGLEVNPKEQRDVQNSNA
jgi:glycosyltransferase involved in cell wall biosynthesis